MKKTLHLIVIFFAIATFQLAAQTQKTTPAIQSSKEQIKPEKPAKDNFSSATDKGKWIASFACDVIKNSSALGTPDEQTSHELQLNPFAGYFVKDRLALGLGLDYSSVKTESLANGNDSHNSFFIAPAARYYLPIANRFMFMGEFKASFGQDKYTSNGIENTPTKRMGISLTPSFVFVATPKISFQAKLGSLSYTSSKGDFDGNRFAFSLFGDGLDLGVNLHFGN